MMNENKRKKQYIAIDLKSFYASVECAERGLDPLDANLVVADESRTDKTICLAVSPSLKAHGIPGRARLFEAKQMINKVNAQRRRNAPVGVFTGKSIFAHELEADPSLELDFIAAPPRMAYYMEYSTGIFEIYSRYVDASDILVYSIDEVFIDATDYLEVYNLTAREFAMKLIKQVLDETRITATAGIGTNMYLAKVAMDIVAKHIPADKDGVRIAELDEMSYREKLWLHRPLTDFWRIGGGTARKLEQNGMYTMGDVARCSLGREGTFYNEGLLYKLFGVNAELLIDHAWGYEPATIAQCMAYVPETKSLSSGQVMPRPYTAEEGRLIVSEMADKLAMDLLRKGLVTNQVVLDVCYDIENLTDPVRAEKYKGPVKADHYGRQAPKPAHGSQNLDRYTSSASLIIDAVCAIYDRITDMELTVRRFNIAVTRLIPESEAKNSAQEPEQLNFFTDYEKRDKENEETDRRLEKEKNMQLALLAIRDKYGKNSIVKGMNMKEGATAMERNRQIGGHKA